MNIQETADLIVRLRARLNLSQEQLAARLNVSFASINRWELGKSKPQRAQRDALLALADEVENESADDDTLTSAATKAKPERRRRGVAHSTVLGNKPMEQMLWDAACQVRGEKDAPKFKDYLLPILFIKRLSDVFDDEVQRLSETYGDRATALAVLDADPSLVRFYLPPQTRWPVISDRQPFKWPAKEQPKTLGELLTSSVRLMVKANPSLAGVIDTIDFNETRNGEREISDKALKGIIEAFSNPRYRLGLHDVEPDFLGRCYEYLLRKFAEGQGQSAGEFFTPREVGFLMAEILRPRPGEDACDFACGSFGLLIKLQLVCKRLDRLSKLPLKLYGQELTGSSYAIACMNRIIHDMQGEVLRGDSMRNPKYRDGNHLRRFDLVVANPMWNQSFDPAIYDNDPFNRFEEAGGITTGKADWAWLQHTVASLKPNGRAAVVLDTGAVTRGSGSKNEDRERNIRRWFVEQDLIDGVILLPDNLFYNTTAAGIIVVLRRNKPKARAGKITLINASREFKKGAPKNYLPEAAVARIAAAYLKGEAQDGLVAVIDKARAKDNDYNLSPSRYLANGDVRTLREIPGIVKELAALKKDEAKLDAELAKVLTQL